MKLVIRVDPETRQLWRTQLSELLPDIEILLWDEDTFESDDIDLAVVWAPPEGMLASLPNLRAVFSVGAGISHITDDPTFPSQLPIIRTTGPVLRQRMCEYVALHTLRIHRRLPEIVENSRNADWKWLVEPTAENKTIGIMGVGNLGAAAAQYLMDMGYKVKGLARRERSNEAFPMFTMSDLEIFLSDVDILISMLPGTAATEDIISKDLIEMMPKGSWVINVGRGSHVKDDDLIAALDSGHLAGAVLDVFRTEPLPQDHPFWSHPDVLVTCHTASAIEAAVGGKIIASNIRKFLAGESLQDLVDPEQGY